MNTVEGGRSDAVPRIVVGVDGSTSSVLALKWAANYAAAVGATIEAVSAWHTADEWGFGGLLPFDWDPEKVASEILEAAIVKAYNDERPANLITSVREGRASQVLLDAGKGADMIVVGSRGHGGFVGMLLGSVSAALAEHSSCPVLVVHGDHPPLPLVRA
jgi:nucleotide-binding universal stress UspA family protein